MVTESGSLKVHSCARVPKGQQVRDDQTGKPMKHKKVHSGNDRKAPEHPARHSSQRPAGKELSDYPEPNLIKHLIHQGPTSQTTACKGSAAIILVPDTRAHTPRGPVESRPEGPEPPWWQNRNLQLHNTEHNVVHCNVISNQYMCVCVFIRVLH